jgi:hypothetical protein
LFIKHKKFNEFDRNLKILLAAAAAAHLLKNKVYI